MFDLSLVELAVIALVALLVLGPERLPRAARTAGLYLRKARQSWYSVKSDIERELAADELRRSLKESAERARREVGDVDRSLRETADMARLTAPAAAASTAAAKPAAGDAAAGPGSDAGVEGDGRDTAGVDDGDDDAPRAAAGGGKAP